MLCEVLLSSLWFLFVIFWVETISVWLFLSMFYQDRVFYHWGDEMTNHYKPYTETKNASQGRPLIMLQSRYPYADRDANLIREKIKHSTERTLNRGL